MKKNIEMAMFIIISGATFTPWIYIRDICEQGPVAGPIPNMFFTPVMISLAIMIGVMNLMVVSSTIRFIVSVLKARYRRAFKK